MSTPIEILLIEDNPADVRLTQEAFKTARIQNNLHVVEDGVAAMAFLHQTSPHEQAPTPDLILLDLNLPKMDGREVLKEVKSNKDLRKIPIVILTTSDDEEDIWRSYDLHANAYLVKPIDIMKFVKMIHSLESFWLTVVKLPPKNLK